MPRSVLSHSLVPFPTQCLLPTSFSVRLARGISATDTGNTLRAPYGISSTEPRSTHAPYGLSSADLAFSVQVLQGTVGPLEIVAEQQLLLDNARLDGDVVANLDPTILYPIDRQTISAYFYDVGRRLAFAGVVAMIGRVCVFVLRALSPLIPLT